MGASALGPVSAALFALLPSLPGGWHEDVPQEPIYPFGIYRIREKNIGGLGPRRGPHQLDIRTSVFSQLAGLAEAQTANAAVVDALEDTALELGPTHQACGVIVFDETVPLPDQELNGTKVHEVVSMFRAYAEAA